MARLLVSNHHEMTAQSISDECGMLCHSCELLMLNGLLSPRDNLKDNKELLKAIEECEDAMDQAEDSLEFHYSKFPTDL